MPKSFLFNLLSWSSIGLVGSFILTSLAPRVQAQNLTEETLVSLRFEAPINDRVPVTVGGGTRGSIRFQTANDRTPVNTVGGGTRGNITFTSPNDRVSSNNVGGGVRGNVTFSSANDRTANHNVSGGVRGNVTFSSVNDRVSNSNVSGGTRAENALELTALLPENQYGRTVSPRPTFFVYLPPGSSQQVFFSIQDEGRNNHYQTIINVSGDGGIVSFTLPEEAPELALETNYLWFFAPIEENGILRPDNPGVTGWIKRVEDQAVNPHGDAIAQATDLAKSGVWYDTLQLLASAQKQEPHNQILAQEWQELLEQVGLENIAQQPLNGLL